MANVKAGDLFISPYGTIIYFALSDLKNRHWDFIRMSLLREKVHITSDYRAPDSRWKRF